MSCVTSRRQFLQSCLVVSAGGLATAAPRFSAAIEPIPRHSGAKFKFSLAAYSYRNLLQGKSASLTLTDFVDDCAKLGLEGTELTSYYFPQPLTVEYLRELKARCFRLGLTVSGTAVGNDFGHSAPEKRQQQIELVRRWVDYSEILGAPTIRIFAGHAQAGASAEDTHRRIVSAIEECCEYAGQHGVYLALENHGGPTSTVEGLLALVRDVKSPWFGVNLDTGNFHSADIYADIAQAAPYAVNVQVKVVVAGPDGKKQPTDFSRIANILRASGYRGYVVLEYEEAADPREECPKYMQQIREAFIA